MKKLLLLFLTFVFCLSAVSFAVEVGTSEQEKLEKIKNELEEKRLKLQETKKKEQQSLFQLVEIKNNLKKSKNQLKRAETKIVVNEEKMQHLQVEIKETDLILKQKSSKLYLRVREIFKSGSVNYLDLIFSAKNMSDFINRSYFFSKLVETDVGLIELISNKYNQVRQKKEILEGVTNEIKDLAVTISQKNKEIAEKEKQEQEVYAGLKERRQEYEERIAKLEKSSEELTYIIQRQARGAKSVSATGVLDWPIRGRITSLFGYRRHPYWGGRHMHTGLDIAAPYGQPIKAADGGNVILSKWWDGYGKAVVISHGNDTSTVYGHMSRIYVQEGDSVVKGQVIGLIGSTGYSTGPHLHFEVRKNGKPRNPVSYLP